MLNIWDFENEHSIKQLFADKEVWPPPCVVTHIFTVLIEMRLNNQISLDLLHI